MFVLWVFVLEEVVTNVAHEWVSGVFVFKQFIFIVENLFIHYIWICHTGGEATSPCHSRHTYHLLVPPFQDISRDLRISLWLLPLWIFKPISDLKDFPQKLQSKPYSFLASFSRFESARFSSSVDSLGGSDFFLQNSSFLLRFLLIWHRESFFLFLVTSLFVDYLEVEMMFRVDSGPSREVEKAMVALPSLQQHPPAADELSNCIVNQDLAFQHLLAPGWHQGSYGLALVVSKEHHCSHFLSEVDRKWKREWGMSSRLCSVV